ncbi:hypothetical protein CBR_g66754 [Chara braunii]|uniref:Integrase catalytic domain-containing protein n=1 Tax=Chara braunii TaxID=69332 RepID=A0A388JQA2_CHABU|nr:hypothetical protein CBR_g66754 [Chara braunii]|eukprot:GBG59948.1 hypothetical protein CBR_g66754 [Chara braunii]
METLKLAAPHYIRCVKPNMQLKPQIFENKNVLQQLRCSGVLEAVRISCAGFPTRRTFEEFLDRFGLLHPEVLIESADEKVACQNLLEKCNLKGYQIGKTKVFLRAGQMAILDTKRSNVLNEAAVKIQHMVQSFLMRKDYERMKSASLLVQAYWRGTMARLEFRFLREQVSAVCFQSATTAVPHQQCHVSSALSAVPRQQCHISSVTSVTVPRQQCHVSSAMSAVPRQQLCYVGNSATSATVPPEEQRQLAAEAVRLQAEAAATAEKQRLQAEADADTQARRKEAQDLLQRHEATSIEKLKFWHFEPSEDAARALGSRVQDLEQTAPKPEAGESSTAPSAHQLEERVDHVVTMLGDISTFVAPATISNQLDTLKSEVQELHQLPNKDSNAVQHYKMPTFQIEKFDDYTHQDPIWLSDLATVHGVDVADLKDKISWEELTRLWKKRFIVDDAPTLAINRLFSMTQGNTSTRDWLTEWQKIAATPDLELPFSHLRREFYNRSCAALSLALGDREPYATFAEIIDKAREIIKTNRAAAHEKSAWQPTYVEKVKTGPRPQHVVAVQSDNIVEDPAATQASREGDQVADVQPRSINKSRGNGKAKIASPAGNGQPTPWVKFYLTEAEYKWHDRYGCCNWCNNTKHKTSQCPDKGKEDVRPLPTPLMDAGVEVVDLHAYIAKIDREFKRQRRRLCIDYRKLNTQTIRNAVPLPRIDDLLERLGGAKFFSKLDLKSGYHQLEIRKEDRYKTSFKTRYGHFEWLVMPFGLTNAPTAFQAAMTTESRHVLDRFVLIYLDDILVYSRSLDEHVEHLRIVLERLRQAKYKANCDKCEFARQELEYLRHYVTPQGIRPLADKIKALRVRPEPTNTTDLRSFMGLAGYYQRFITGYSRIVAPMTRLQSPKVPFVFDDDARRSFQALKTAMLMAPVLSMYDPTLPTRVTTDPSGYGIGAVLEQHDGDDWHPVEYFSNKVPPINSLDDARKKELLAFVMTLKRWRHFLLGRRRFTWVTDNNPLTYYKTQDTVSSTIGRWMYFIDRFGFTLKHLPGLSNYAPDALSRRSDLCAMTYHAFAFDALSRRSDLCAMTYHAFAFDKELQQHFIRGYESDPHFATFYAQLSSDHPPASHSRGKDLLFCRRIKPRNRNPYGELRPMPIPREPGLSIAMDVTRPFPRDRLGHDGMLTVVDRLSKYARFLPCKYYSTAPELARLLHTGWICGHGVPEDIVSDRDTCFMSTFWTALMQESDTKMKPSSARHPLMDGQTEWAHQTAQMMLRTLILPDQKDWVDRLPDIEFTYNTSVHPAIGVTPFALHNGGRKGRIFADLLLPRPADIDAACSPAFVRKYRELLAQARANMQKAQVRMQQQANRRRVPCPIRAGDLVWVFAEEFALEQDVSRKLLPKWFGPWPVTSAAGDEPDGPSFVINIPPHLMVHPVFHASKLVTYTPAKSDDFPGRRSQDPPSMDGHQEADGVITDRKYDSKPQQYKVTFKAHSVDFRNRFESIRTADLRSLRATKISSGTFTTCPSHPDCGPSLRQTASPSQSKWRSYVAFRSYDELLRSCIVFQGAWRCKEARSEIKKLRQAARETGALREAKNRLEKKCEELTLRLGLAKVSLIARNSELAKLQSAMEEAKAQVEQMKMLVAKERKGHEADLAQAKVAAAQLLDAKMSAQPSKEVLDKIEALSEENTKLKKLVEDYEKKKALAESSAKRIEEADLKRDAMQELLSRSEEQVQNLISENQSLQSEKENLQSENRILRQQALNMKDLESENQDLQRNLTHLETNSQALRAENETLKQQLEQLTSKGGTAVKIGQPAVTPVFIRHETTFKALDKKIATLQAEISTLQAANSQQQTINGQLQNDVSTGLARLSAAASAGSAVADCSPALAAQAKQLEERINHVVASLGDISKFVGALTVSNQLQTLSDRVQQRPAAVAKEWKMPNFKIEKFDDYHKTDPLQWWMAFNAEADVHHTPPLRRLDALYLQPGSWSTTTSRLEQDLPHVSRPATFTGVADGVAKTRRHPGVELIVRCNPGRILRSVMRRLDSCSGSEFQYETFDGMISKARELIQVPPSSTDGGVAVVDLRSYLAKIDREHATQRYVDIDVPLLYIRIQIGKVTCSALIDCGASRNYISQDFMARAGLGPRVRRKSQPTHVTLVDGHTQKSIDRCVDSVAVYFAPLACEAVSFDILDTKFDMILGMSWLQSEDHPVNFYRRTVHVRDRRGELVPCTVPLSHPSIVCHLVSAASIRQSIRRNDIEEMGICFLHALPPGDQPKTDTSDPRIIELLDNYEDVFQAPAGVIQDRPIRHGITLEDGAVAPRGCIYRMSEEELQVLRAQLDDLLAKGWIRPSCSTYGAPVLFVRKKNKDLRLCINYRKLNAQTIKNADPLPRIDDLFERLGGAKYFSKLDLQSGYHQIEIQPRDWYKTTFKTRYGHFEWIVMPFGLTNAPATFQAAMTTKFRNLLDLTVLIYLDDRLVYSRTLDEHLEHLRAILERLRITKYKANRDKCEFAQQELEYLGHYVTSQGIRPLADKVQPIQDWSDLKCTTDVRSFLGLASYYMLFVKGFQRIAAPLSRLQSPLVPFEFNDEARHAFHMLKTTLLQAPVFSIYDPTLPTKVTMDAFGYGTGSLRVVLEGSDVDLQCIEAIGGVVGAGIGGGDGSLLQLLEAAVDLVKDLIVHLNRVVEVVDFPLLCNARGQEWLEATDTVYGMSGHETGVPRRDFRQYAGRGQVEGNKIVPNALHSQEELGTEPSSVHRLGPSARNTVVEAKPEDSMIVADSANGLGNSDAKASAGTRMQTRADYVGAQDYVTHTQMMQPFESSPSTDDRNAPSPASQPLHCVESASVSTLDRPDHRRAAQGSRVDLLAQGPRQYESRTGQRDTGHSVYGSRPEPRTALSTGLSRLSHRPETGTLIKPTPEPVITTSYPDEQPTTPGVTGPGTPSRPLGRSQHIRRESSDYMSLRNASTPL